MKEAGIEIVEFDPIFSAWLLETVNYRNHRKIIIVDGKLVLPEDSMSVMNILAVPRNFLFGVIVI